MTETEFEEFCRGEQWTPEQIARFQGFIPTCDAQTVKREMARPDGIIPVARVKSSKSILAWLFG